MFLCYIAFSVRGIMFLLCFFLPSCFVFVCFSFCKSYILWFFVSDVFYFCDCDRSFCEVYCLNRIFFFSSGISQQNLFVWFSCMKSLNTTFRNDWVSTCSCDFLFQSTIKHQRNLCMHTGGMMTAKTTSLKTKLSWWHILILLSKNHQIHNE